MNEEIWWFHLDMTHGSYNGVLNGLQGKANSQRPLNIFSVNENILNTQSLAKVVAEQGWFASPDANFVKNSPSLIFSFSPANHNQALLMVKDIAWTGL